MNDLISRQAAIDKLKSIITDREYTSSTDEAKERIAREFFADIPSSDSVEVVRCKDCKHRPIDTQEEGNGFDYEFPEEYSCPGYCDDGYYSQRFKDDFYCAWGERAEE